MMKDHEKGYQIYKGFGGNISCTDIAKLLNVTEGAVRKWKSRYKWDEAVDFVKQDSDTEQEKATYFTEERREAETQKIIDLLKENKNYSPALDILIGLYVDTLEEYEVTRSDKLRKELVRYLGQLGLTAKYARVKKEVEIDKEKEVDATKTTNKLLQFRQRNVNG